MIDEFGLQLGPLYVRFYGLILMTGAFLGAWLASREARRHGQDPQLVWDALIWALVGGIIGARLYHVLTPSPSMGITPLWYLQNPLEILAVWKGGLGIYGGIIGGALGLWLYTRRQQLDFWTWLDIAAPGITLGQAIGRWGNFVNQELYGAPTSVPWAIYIRPENRLPGFESFSTFHPTFFYEALWNLGTTIVLVWVVRRFSAQLKRGDVITLYFILSPIGRIVTEVFRLDSFTVSGFSLAQALSALMTVVALAILLYRHRGDFSRAEVVTASSEARR